MALGQNEEGQQLFPMAFDFDVATYVPADHGLPGERPQTRQEMLDSGCPSLAFTAQGGWGDGVFRFDADCSNGCGHISDFMMEEQPEEDAVLVPVYNQNGRGHRLCYHLCCHQSKRQLSGLRFRGSG